MHSTKIREESKKQINGIQKEGIDERNEGLDNKWSKLKQNDGGLQESYLQERDKIDYQWYLYVLRGNLHFWRISHKYTHF